jgi:very-short-patch-repair endonuclease
MPFRGMRVGEREMDKSVLRQRARNLRKNCTYAEKHLWFNLRANRLGFKFKRQVPLGTYIVDFVCFEKRLIVELDGGQHMDNQTYDMARTTWLNSHGFKVLRFWNNDVLQQTSSVIEVIMGALSNRVKS